jgi:hypothetical protein
VNDEVPDKKSSDSGLEKRMGRNVVFTAKVENYIGRRQLHVSASGGFETGYEQTCRIKYLRS